MSFDAIAARLGMSREAVRKLYRHGMEKLRAATPGDVRGMLRELELERDKREVALPEWGEF